MSSRRQMPARRRYESWLWTGPLGHLVGGALDLVTAMCSFALTRARRTLWTQVRARPPAGGGGDAARRPGS